MNTVEIKLGGDQAEVSPASGNKSLGSAVLLHNAIWFTKVRWIIMTLFIVTGTTGLIAPKLFIHLGLVAPGWWIIILAAILATANIYFHIHEKHLNGDSSVHMVKYHIWTQIIIDLIVVTVLVYMVGSIETFICFTYLFHIVLTCIFFSPAQSLGVTILAAGLYTSCTLLEGFNIIPRTCMLIDDHFVVKPELDLYMLYTFSAISVWFIVWYLVSTLSQSVRTRDIQLAEANRELIRADQEKNKKVLRTTHDLKAPFSGIESNIELLRAKHWDELSDPVKKIIDRIQNRSQTLSERIKEILVLGDLRSAAHNGEDYEDIRVADLIDAVLDELKGKVKARNVTIRRNIPDCTAKSNRKKLFFLFSNIISNAISYSHEKGTVDIEARETPDGISISVADKGIGITEEALPHIFDEYYRSIEGASFNKQSTGLGLAIVKEIAQSLKLGIIVSTEINQGTKFEITIPAEKNTRSSNG